MALGVKCPCWSYLPQKPVKYCPLWWRVCSPWLRWCASYTPMASQTLRRPTRDIAIPLRPLRRTLTLDLHCLVAILPAVVMLLWLCLDELFLSVLLTKLVVPAFPPFIPPKALTHA